MRVARIELDEAGEASCSGHNSNEPERMGKAELLHSILREMGPGPAPEHSPQHRPAGAAPCYPNYRPAIKRPLRPPAGFRFRCSGFGVSPQRRRGRRGPAESKPPMNPEALLGLSSRPFVRCQEA